MEESQVSQFCIDLKDVMLPDAIAALVEAWYEVQTAQSIIIEDKEEEKYYTVSELQKLLNRSRASVYRMLNTEKHNLNPPFDPYKLNHEYRCDITDPIRVSSREVFRLKNTPKPTAVKPSDAEKIDPSCKSQALDFVSRLIKAGLLSIGDKMPSIRELADRIGFHRNSVLKVYQELEQNGAIVLRPGLGFYIADTNMFSVANVTEAIAAA
jgi:AraC-like DNA-binding protein